MQNKNHRDYLRENWGHDKGPTLTVGFGSKTSF